MKAFLSVLLTSFLVLAFALPALARTTTVYGRGQDSGFCSYNQGQFCIQRIEDKAARDGERDSHWKCQVLGGQPRGYTSTCNTSCFPNYLGPNDRSVAVRCTASCSLTCDVRD